MKLEIKITGDFGAVRHWTEVRAEAARAYARICMNLAGGVVSKAAKLAGMDRTNFRRFLRGEGDGPMGSDGVPDRPRRRAPRAGAEVG